MSDIPQIDLGNPFEDSLQGAVTSLQRVLADLQKLNATPVSNIQRQLAGLSSSLDGFSQAVKGLAPLLQQQLSEAGKVGSEGFAKNLKAGLASAKEVGKRAASEVAKEVSDQMGKALQEGAAANAAGARSAGKKTIDEVIAGVEGEKARAKSAVRAAVQAIQEGYEEGVLSGKKYSLTELMGLKASGASLFPEHRVALHNFNSDLKTFNNTLAERTKETQREVREFRAALNVLSGDAQTVSEQAGLSAPNRRIVAARHLLDVGVKQEDILRLRGMNGAVLEAASSYKNMEHALSKLSSVGRGVTGSLASVTEATKAAGRAVKEAETWEKTLKSVEDRLLSANVTGRNAAVFKARALLSKGYSEDQIIQQVRGVGEKAVEIAKTFKNLSDLETWLGKAPKGAYGTRDELKALVAESRKSLREAERWEKDLKAVNDSVARAGLSAQNAVVYRARGLLDKGHSAEVLQTLAKIDAAVISVAQSYRNLKDFTQSMSVAPKGFSGTSSELKEQLASIQAEKDLMEVKRQTVAQAGLLQQKLAQMHRDREDARRDAAKAMAEEIKGNKARAEAELKAAQAEIVQRAKVVNARLVQIRSTKAAEEAMHLASLNQRIQQTKSAFELERRVIAEAMEKEIKGYRKHQKELEAERLRNLRGEAKYMGLGGKDSDTYTARGMLQHGYAPSEVASMAGMSRAAVEAAQSMGRLGDQTKGASGQSKLLRAELGALRSGMHELHSGARGLASGFNAMWLTWGSVVPLMAGAAISHSFVTAARDGMKFEDILNRISATSGASKEAVEGLRQEALTLGSQGVHGPLELAEAMRTMSMAGLRAGDEIKQATAVVSAFANVGDMNLKEASEGLIAVSTAYGYSAQHFGVVSDTIAYTANTSMASVQSMTEAFRQASVVAQQYGVSLRDTSVLIGLLSQVGIQGSSAGTAIRNMYTELMGSSKKAREVLKNNLKVDVWDEQTKSMKSAVKIFEELGGALQKLSTKAQQTVLTTLGNERGTKGLSVGLVASIKLVGQATGDLEAFSGKAAKALSLLGNTKIAAAMEVQLAELQQSFQQTGSVSAEAVRMLHQALITELTRKDAPKAAQSLAEELESSFKSMTKGVKSQLEQMQLDLANAPGYVALANLSVMQSSLSQVKATGNALSAALISSFEAANPAILELSYSLRQVFQSNGFQEALRLMVSGLAEFLNLLVNNASLVGTYVAVMASLKVATLLAAGATVLFNRVKEQSRTLTLAKVAALSAASRGYAAVAATASTGSIAVTGFGRSVSAAAVATKAAGGALLRLSGPIGSVITLLGLAASAWYTYKAAQGSATSKTNLDDARAAMASSEADLQALIDKNSELEKQHAAGASGQLAELRSQAQIEMRKYRENSDKIVAEHLAVQKEANQKIEEAEKKYGIYRGKNGSWQSNSAKAAYSSAVAQAKATRDAATKEIDNEYARLERRNAQLSKFLAQEDAKQKRAEEESRRASAARPSGTEGFDPDAIGKAASADKDRIERARKVRDNELAMLQKSYQTEAALLESSLNTQKTILDNARSAMAVTEGSYMAQELTLQTQHETSSIEQAQAHLTEYTAAFLEALEDRQNAYNEFVSKNQGKKGFAEAQQQEKDALEQDLVNKAREFNTYYEQVTAGIAKTQDALRIRSAKLVSEAAGAANKYKKALEDQSRAEKRRLEDANSRAKLERAAIGLSERAITAMQAEFEERRRVAELARGYEDDLREAQKAEIQYIEEVNRLQEGGQWTDAQVLGLTLLASKSKAAAAALDEVNSGLEAGVDNAKKLALFELETKQIAKLTDDLAGAVMTALQEGGDKGAEALRKVLVAELSKPISLIVKAFVQPIAQTVSSVSGGLSNVVGNFLNGGSIDEATAGLNDVMGAVSMGTNTAISVAGSLTSFNAKIISKFGTSIATEAMGNFAAGMSSAGSLESAKTAFEAGGAQIGGMVVGSVMNGFTGYSLSKMISNGYEVNKYMNKIGAAASMIPGVGPIAGVISGTVNRAFGRKLADTGIEGTFGTSDGFDGNSYEFYKGGWFRSDKTKRKALDPQLEDMLEGTFNYAKIEMALLATSVGLGVDSLDNFTKSIKVSFKGLSSEDASKRLEEEFQKVRESMADAVLGTKEYSQVGETSLETLERLSKAIGSINPMFELLGYNMFQTSLAGASAADMLAQKFGGVDAATQALSSYYDNYYSEFERNSAALKQVQGAFERLGISMPALTTDLTGLATNGDEARKQFRGLVDAARAAGDDDLFIGLMNLQSAFLSLTPSTQEAANSVEAIATRLASLARSVVTSAGRTSVGASSTALEQARNALGAVSGKPAAVVTAEKVLAERQALQTTLAEIYASAASGVSSAAEKVRAANDYYTKHEGGVYSSISGKAEDSALALQLTGNKNEAYDLVGRSNEAIDSSLNVLDQVVAAANKFAAALGVTNTVDVNAGFSVRANKNSNSYAQILLNGQVVDSIDQGRGGDSGKAFSDFVNEIKNKVFKAVLQGAYSSVDEVLSDGFLIAQKNYVTEVTSAWDKATAKSAEALQELATALTPLLEDQVNLGIELLRAQGRAVEADAAERTKALGEATAGLSGSAADAVTAAYDYNQQIKQQIKYQEALNALSSDRAAIEVDLLRAKGLEGSAEAAQRAIDLAEATKGLGASEAAAVTAAYDYNRQLEKQVTFNQTLTDLIGQVGDQEVALLRAYGDDSRADALETQRELTDMTRGLTEAQRDSITVAYNYRKELERQATTVTERRGLENQLLELADNQSEIRRRELQAIQPANRGLQTMVWRIEDLKDGIPDLESSVKDFRDTAKSLRSTASDLLAGDNSPLTPAEKYAQVKGKFTATSALAASGDKAAMEDLSGLSKTFLEVSRAYNASGSAYTSDFNLVQKALADGAVSADAKADVAQMQLDATKAQTQAASTLAVALGKLTEAFQGRFGSTDVDSSGGVSLGEFKSGFKGLAADSTLTDVFNILDSNGDDTLSLLESGNALEEASKVAYTEALREAGTALETGFTALGTAYSTGSGDVSAALNTVASTISPVATAISNMSVNVSVTVPSAPVVASAKGNVFTNGIVDRSTYFDTGLMGEAGPEAIMPLSRGPNGSLGVRVYAPQQNSQAGAQSGGNDQALLEELRALRLEVKQLREQNNAGHSLNAQATTRSAQTLAGSVEASSSKARHAAKIDRKVSLV